MRQLILILFVLSLSVSAMQAQDIRALFIEAPDSVFPLLPRGERADCVDFADAKMVYPVSNLLGGKSTLKELNDNYLLLQSSGASTLEMKLLPAGDSCIICVVNTVCSEAADSRVAFFDSDWNRLDAKRFFTSPAIKDFLTVADNKVLDMCDIYLVSLKLNALDNTMIAEYTMPDYMNNDDATKVRSMLKKIVYSWNGERFVIE